MTDENHINDARNDDGEGGVLAPDARARLEHLFGPRDETTLVALARYEALIARPGHALGFAGGLAAHWLRQRWPEETAVLDAARRAGEAAANTADPLRPHRHALEAVRRSLAADLAGIEERAAVHRDRLLALDGVIAALASGRAGG